MAQGVTGGLLTRKGLILAKVETVAGQDALPTPLLDAVLVSEPEFSLDPNILEREFLAGDLSPFEHIVGRKLASISFTTELKSNGLAQNGDVVTNEPRLARLMRGCGYTLSERLARHTSFTTNFAVNNDLTLAARSGNDHGMQTGDGPVQVFANGGTLPTGTLANTDYWVIRKSGTAFALAVSRANALIGTEVVLSVADAAGAVQVGGLPTTRINPDPTNDIAFQVDNAFYLGYQEAQAPYTENAFTEPVLYTVEVTTGGASGVAQVTISSNNEVQDDTSANIPVTVTSGTQIELAGATGSNIYFTFEFTVDMVLGDKWNVLVSPVGILANPVSENFDCLTLYFYEDGLRYRVLASQGTFTIDATAGNFGSMEFTFTGQFTPVIDAALPTNEVFETTLPQQVELGLLTWGSNVALTVEQWTFDQANNVVPRPSVNKSDGFDGVRISDRTPTGGFNPEATLVADEDFWGDFAAAVAKVFTARTGTAVGNQIVAYGPRVQTSEIAFGDRDGIRSFDHTMLLKRLSGNDEMQFYFT